MRPHRRLLHGEDFSKRRWRKWNNTSTASSRIHRQKVTLPQTPLRSRLIVAREASLAATKKDTQNKNVGAGRMTLQERLAASIAKSRTGSPKAGASEEAGTTNAEDGGEANSNGVLKVSVPSSPVRTETPKLPVSPVKLEAPTIDVKEDTPTRTETPDISVIPPTESTPPPPPPLLPAPEEQFKDSQPIEPNPPIEQQPVEITPRASSISLPSDTDPATLDLISQLRNDLATCEARRVEESQIASARISSLEQKLKLLFQTTLDHSKDQAANPTASSWERKLADREEKIALLLDEGPLSPLPQLSWVSD